MDYHYHHLGYSMDKMEDHHHQDLHVHHHHHQLHQPPPPQQEQVAPVSQQQQQEEEGDHQNQNQQQPTPPPPQQQQRKQGPVAPTRPMEQMTNIQQQPSSQQPQHPVINNPPVAFPIVQRPQSAMKKRRSSRPQTARRGPPKVRTNIVKEEPKVIDHSDTVATGVITEGDNVIDDDNNDDDDNDIVDENIHQQQQAQFGINDDTDEKNEGKLMRDMRNALKKTQQQQTSFKRVGRNSNTPKSYSSEQVEELRNRIQRMCQSVNPLGKCIAFLEDDLDQMRNEEQSWLNVYNEENAKMSNAKSETKQILQQYHEQLESLASQSRTYERTIRDLKASIISNDGKINMLIESKLL